MERFYTIVLTGTWGSGKSLMALSFTPPFGEAKRLVVDMEARAVEYNAQALGYNQDVPDKLAYAFDMWPDEYGDFGPSQLLEFISKPELRAGYNVLVWDNFSIFTDKLSGWLQDAAYARQLTTALGIYRNYANFIETRFKVDPSFHNMVREVIRQIILVLKRSQMHIVLTAELRNVWQNYGAKGYDKDGKPLQRIIGKTARLSESVFAMADVIWHLSRNREVVTAKPTVSIDPLNPKCSIVGVPATFQFNGWDDIWKAVRSRQAAVDYSSVEMPKIEYVEPEEKLEGGFETEQEAKEALVRALVQEMGLYADRADIANTLKQAGIQYTMERHFEILEWLISVRQVQQSS